MALAAPASATIYAVGTGAGCTHSSFLAALGAATADASPGPHEIRLALPTITLASADYVIANPAQDLVVSGGYASCAAAAPSGRTVLNRIDPNRTVLEVSNGSANPRRSVTLERLTLQGANLSSGLGGGLRVANKADVTLFNTFIENNLAPSGGGVSLQTLSTNPNDGPRMVLADDSRICNNTANGPGADGNGGGVFVFGAATLELRDGSICDNQARRHGGGVYLSGIANRMLIDPVSTEVVAINNNRSGTAGFAVGTGFGGGVYAGPESTIAYPSLATPPAAFSLSISGNEANFGGGLFAEGVDTAGGPFNSLVLRNAVFANNVARGSGGAVELRNAVDLRLIKFGRGRCLFGVTDVPCVLGLGNRADNTGGSSDFGAGGFARLSHEAGAPRPALRVAGALFATNQDPNGTAAVIDARGDSAVRILRSVFVDNSAGGSAGLRAMVESRSEVLFAYNTVLNNAVTRLLWVAAGGSVIANGSILHAPGVTPFVGPSGGLQHGGCLLSHTATGLPPGVTVAAPQLGAGYEPLLASEALDSCAAGVADVFWPAGLDAYGQTAPVDLPQIANLNGPWDIGAVERQEVLFANGFE